MSLDNDNDDFFYLISEEESDSIITQLTESELRDVDKYIYGEDWNMGFEVYQSNASSFPNVDTYFNKINMPYFYLIDIMHKVIKWNK